MMLTYFLMSLSLFTRKSTFFNVLTKSGAPAENFPFCTIDPNESELICCVCLFVVSGDVAVSLCV